MNILQYLAQFHKGWLDIAQAFIGNDYRYRDYAEDYVQDAYLKIAEEGIEYKSEKQLKKYMIKTIKSIIINDKKKARPEVVSIEGTLYKLGLDPTKYRDLRVILERLEKIENGLYWFDREMWRLYRSELSSIRKIAKATKISHVTVFRTLKRCKDIIREKLKADYYEKK